MFKKIFKYYNPNELWNVLMDGDRREYDELLNDLKIKQSVLSEQINTNTGVERIRLKHLVNVVEDVLDDVRGKKDLHLLEIPD